MSDIAIRVEDLSKQYRIGARQEGYKTLRDTLTDAFASPFRRAGRLLRGQATGAAGLNETFWALKNIAFEINRGEVVGIVGRNGAGKSTLLKILSRITEPATGFAEIHGRVGSLLEVGTGFHPELTGRENIYLNGAVLGMTRSEIDRKFDEIVDFAEVERFVDTPVKHFSSGMYLRLAFAVAAYLEPDILIIDEVLAVGDAAFQKKCLGKMENVAKGGRTVLFVSHNMMAVKSLCSRAIFLEDGEKVYEGPAKQAVEKYQNSMQKLDGRILISRRDKGRGEELSFTSVQFFDLQTMTPISVLESGQSVIVRIGYVCNSATKLTNVGMSISFYTLDNTQLFGCKSRAVETLLEVQPGEGYTDCVVDKWPLRAGRYLYHLHAEKNRTSLDWLPDAGYIDVENGDYYGSGILPSQHLPGVLIDYSWQHNGQRAN